MSNNKMKGLLKGLRYISQIFDNEKEPEMQIGFPTDVKHVAHIGWDGPSVNSPSWMNEFKQPGGGYSSAPLTPRGDLNDDGSGKWVSEDRKKASQGMMSPARDEKASQGMMSPARDVPELPRSSRRHSSTGAESPTMEKSDKPRQSRRASRNAIKDSADGTRSRHQKARSGGGEPGSMSLPDQPKKSGRKKSKDSSVGGSSSRSSRSKSQGNDQMDSGSEGGSVSKSSLAIEQCHTSALTNLEGGEEAGYTRIS